MLRAVHHEGIQVLNLTEFPYSDSDVPSLKQDAEYWLQERKAFLSTVSALKDLIAKMQFLGNPEVTIFTKAFFLLVFVLLQFPAPWIKNYKPVSNLK